MKEVEISMDRSAGTISVEKRGKNTGKEGGGICPHKCSLAHFLVYMYAFLVALASLIRTDELLVDRLSVTFNKTQRSTIEIETRRQNGGK
jgi:hypothetical protein